MSYLDVLTQRDGFGKNATGGASGPVHKVTSLADSGSGTLREALAKSGPLWIYFGVSGTITLKTPLTMTSNKTVDGRDRSVTIKGSETISGIRMDGASNVILLNFALDGGYADTSEDSEGADAINIRGKAQDIWLHHLKIHNWSDGAVDIKDHNVKGVSITRCRVEKVWQALACESTDISVGYCYSLGVGARFPKAIGGQVVSYNNVIYKWLNAGIQGVKGDAGELLAWRNMYRRSSLQECNDRAGGKIQVTAPWFAEGLTDVKFVGGSDAVSRDFVDRVKAVCKVSTPGQSLYDDVVFRAGPTLPGASYDTQPAPAPAPAPEPMTTAERLDDLDRRVKALEAAA